MASYSPAVFSNSPHWDWRNAGSSYVTDEYDPPLYSILQFMTAQEYLLHCIARLEPENRPQYLYASSNLVHHHRPAARDAMAEETHHSKMGKDNTKTKGTDVPGCT